jgi:hypothetical protein
MKQLIRIIATLLLIFLVLFAGLYFYASSHKEVLFQKVTNRLNKHLATEIYIQDINLALLRTFPNFSVRFDDVFVHSVPDFDQQNFDTNTDTLLFAKKIYLEISIPDLIKKQYNITKIRIINGELNALTDNNGRVNYKFWISEKSAGKNVDLNLQKIQIKDFNIQYTNLYKNTSVFFDRSNIEFQAIIDSTKTELHSEGTFILSDLYINDQSVIQRQKCHYQLHATQSGHVWSLQKSNIDLSGQEIHLEGTVRDSNMLDLNIYAKNIKLIPVNNLLPKKVSDQINIEGSTSFNFDVQGILSHKILPQISGAFNVYNGSVFLRKRDVELDNVNLKGWYSNGIHHTLQSSTLKIDEGNLSIQNSKIDFDGTIKNLLDLNVNGNIQGSVNLSDITGLLNRSDIEKISGKSEFRISLQGRLKEKNPQKINMKGTASIRDGAMHMKNKQVYKNISGDLSLSSKTELKNLYFTNNGNDFLINGFTNHIFDFFKSKLPRIDVEASIFSENLVLDDIIKSNKNEHLNNKNNDEKKKNFLFPDNIYLKGSFRVKTFKWKRFSASNIEGRVSYKPRSMILNAVTLDAMNGKISGGGIITQMYDQSYMVKIQSKIDKIDINKLFYSFHDFGQTVLKHTNIRGDLLGSISYTSDVTPHFKVDMSSLKINSNVTIHNGELLNFTPLEKLSGFIEISELREISFSELNTSVSIKDKVISLPSTFINSSALDLTLSGKHSFENLFEYHLVLSLNDLLAKKAKKSSSVTEFGEIRDDGMGRHMIFLRVAGTPEDYDISYDKNAASQSLKKNIREEKKEIKSIFKEEFGLYQKDPTLNQDTKEEEEPVFQTQWEDEASDETGSKHQQKQEPTQKKNPEEEKKRIEFEWSDD